MSEHDNGWDFAKRLSDALLKVRPLGGSEMFVKRNNKYYADPSYCGQLIDEKAESEIKWIKRAISAEKNNEALVKALQLARTRIEYLGAACQNPKHFEANAETFLPAIDEVLVAAGRGSADV